MPAPVTTTRTPVKRRTLRASGAKRSTPRQPSDFTAVHAALWSEAVKYHAKAVEYVERDEWLGSYYNTRLAIAGCEHVMAWEQGAKTTESAQGSLPRSRPPRHARDVTMRVNDVPGTLADLRATLPRYEAKLHAFQRAFGCPAKGDGTATGTGKSSTTSTTAPTRLNPPVDADCATVQPVDLRADPQPVTFDDIVGNRDAKQTIEDTLINPVLLPHLYTTHARALLFYGPPGTGKTLLARASAHELNHRRGNLRVLFFAPTGDAFKGKYVGETEAKIVRLFRCASQRARELERTLQRERTRAYAGSQARSDDDDDDDATASPRVFSVLFIDEIDSLARRRDIGGKGRGASTGGPSSTIISATNTLLQTMDGINSYDNVIVMGATNYPWNIDSAVLRRFDSQVYVPLPTEQDMVALLQANIVGRLKTVLLGDLASKAGAMSESGAIPIAATTPADPSLHRLRHAYAQLPAAELFRRWTPLHGVTPHELETLVSQMVTTSRRIGFAPRDVARLCDVVFKREATQAFADPRGFYPVRRRKGVDVSAMHDELLRLLTNRLVSAESFRYLQRSLGDAVDTNARAVHPGHTAFPTSVTVVDEGGAGADKTTSTRYTEWTTWIEASAANAEASVGSPGRAPPPPGASSATTPQLDLDVLERFHVYVADVDADWKGGGPRRTAFSGQLPRRVAVLLYRTFEVAAEGQTQEVPVLLFGRLVSDTAHTITVDHLLRMVDRVRFVMDDRMYETQLRDSAGHATGLSLRRHTLAQEASHLEVREEATAQWLGWLQQRLYPTGTKAESDDGGEPMPTAVGLVHRLWVKGTLKTKDTQAGQAKEPATSVCADVSARYTVQFASDDDAYDDEADASHDDPPRARVQTRRSSAPLLPCTHTLLDMQTFLDAKHAVQPNAHPKTIRDLDEYQRTKKEPQGID